MSDGIRARLQGDLATAMKARDRDRVAVLRSTLAAIANGEAVEAVTPGSKVSKGLYSAEAERRVLTEDDVREIVERERAELLHAAGELHDHGEPGRAGELTARAAILDGYLAG